MSCALSLLDSVAGRKGRQRYYTEKVYLNNGNAIPLVGLGTSGMRPTEIRGSIRKALESGYRLIDTAYVYGCERAIGSILSEFLQESNVSREEVFLSTKLPFFAHEAFMVETMVENSLKGLKVDYLDLYLIHAPTPITPQPGSKCALVVENKYIPLQLPHIDTWRSMEKLVKRGIVKNLGVCNFNVDQLESLLQLCEIKPSVLQIEVHIHWPQNELVEFCKENNITIMAYAPLGSPGRRVRKENGEIEITPLTEPLVLELAEKYKKTPGQILLRQLTQRGLVVIPKMKESRMIRIKLNLMSNNDIFRIILERFRIPQNLNIFDFELTEQEMEKFSALETRLRQFKLAFISDHPEYPFMDVDTSEMNAGASPLAHKSSKEFSE